MKGVLAGAIFALGIVAVGLASAQQYPTKPVHIIVPFAPGGGSDFIGRFIAQKLSERLGQQFIVDRLNSEAGQILKSKPMEDLLAADGVTPAGGTPEQFQALIKTDIARWRKVVERAGVKVE